MAEIILDKINYTYSDGTAYEIQALKDVNLQIHQGEFIGIIGHTGSGKSTLTQLLNGLLRCFPMMPAAVRSATESESIFPIPYDR